MQHTLLLVLASLFSLSSMAERGRFGDAVRRHLDQRAQQRQQQQQQQQGQRPTAPQQQSPYAQFEAAEDAITAAAKKRFYELYDRYDDDTNDRNSFIVAYMQPGIETERTSEGVKVSFNFDARLTRSTGQPALEGIQFALRMKDFDKENDSRPLPIAKPVLLKYDRIPISRQMWDEGYRALRQAGGTLRGIDTLNEWAEEMLKALGQDATQATVNVPMAVNAILRGKVDMGTFRTDGKYKAQFYIQQNQVIPMPELTREQRKNMTRAQIKAYEERRNAPPRWNLAENDRSYSVRHVVNVHFTIEDGRIVSEETGVALQTPRWAALRLEAGNRDHRVAHTGSRVEANGRTYNYPNPVEQPELFTPPARLPQTGRPLIDAFRRALGGGEEE